MISQTKAEKRAEKLSFFLCKLPIDKRPGLWYNGGVKIRPRTSAMAGFSPQTYIWQIFAQSSTFFLSLLFSRN
jgi:hypothetical protein